MNHVEEKVSEIPEHTRLSLGFGRHSTPLIDHIADIFFSLNPPEPPRISCK